MLKLTDLALRPDFRLGPMLVSPSRRLVEGPGGYVHVEPLIMQVFLLLLDAGGKVVTRNELFDQVWGGVMVGDDSLNRAIAKIRRIGEQVAPGLFDIETIPRTGYRLTGEIQFQQQMPESIDADHPAGGHRISRRLLLGSGAAVAAAVGGLGLWSVRRSQADRRFDELMDRGEQALEYGDPSVNPAQYYRQAAAIRPDDAKAQGLLAYSQANAAEFGQAGDASAALQEAERATRAALALDPNEPNARLALIRLQRSMLDLATTEDRLREVLATAPNNILAMRDLWAPLQSSGRSRDTLAMIERALAVKPLAAANNYPRAQLLWILGRNAEADRVIDRAMQFWPSHRFVRFARFTIYAYTGRPRAALAMLNGEQTRPQNYTPEAISLWRVSLAAIDQRTPASISAARRANLEVARRTPALSNQAILTLSTLGEVDAAFEIAEELFAVRRPSGRQPRAAANWPPAKSTAWRTAPWLFTPPTAPMRADPRFKTICDGIGLTEYWAKRGIKPDYQLGIV